MELRPPRLEEAAAVLALIEARDLHDTGVIDFTLADLEQEWRRSEFDLARDAAVLESGGALVAYSVVRRPGSMAMVHPAHEGHGYGAAILGWTEQRERERGRSHHRQWISAGCEPARALLTEAGYTHVRSYSRMVRTLVHPEPTAAVPAGLRFRAIDVENDAAAVHALDAEAFGAAPDYNAETLAEFREEHLGAHDLAPELTVIAEHAGDDGDDGALAGFALIRRWEDESVGYVDVLAVRPPFQRRGVASAMLRETFARCAAVGLDEVQLGVASDNPRALWLYGRVGMTERFRDDIYERPVADR